MSVQLQSPKPGVRWKAKGLGACTPCRRTTSHVAARGKIFEYNPGEATRVEVDLPRPPEDLPDFGDRPTPSGDWVEKDSTSGNSAVSRRGNTNKSFKGSKSNGQVVFAPSDPSGLDQRLLNAFYWGSFLHDFFYPLGFDEAVVGRFEDTLRGVPLPMAVGTYPLWVLQRGLDWFRAQSDPDRKAGRELMEQCGGAPLLDVELRRRLTRVGSRMALE